MSKNDLAIADNQLAAIRHSLPVGTYIRHNKSGDVYQVIGHELREYDLAPSIRYTETTLQEATDPFKRFAAAFGGKPHPREWTRPFAEIFEEVTIPGALWDGHFSTRFTRVKPMMIWAIDDDG